MDDLKDALRNGLVRHAVERPPIHTLYTRIGLRRRRRNAVRAVVALTGAVAIAVATVRTLEPGQSTRQLHVTGQPSSKGTMPTITTTVTTALPVPAGPSVTLSYARAGVAVAATAPNQGTQPPHLYMSTDAATWRDITPELHANSGGLYPTFNSAFFLSLRVGWVTTFDTATEIVDLFRTTDGGASWQTLEGTRHGLHAGAGTTVYFDTEATGWMATFDPAGSGAEIKATSDGGAHWALVGEAATGPPPFPVVFGDTVHGFAAPERFGWSGPGASVLSSTSNGGRTWAPTTLPAPVGVDPTADATILVPRFFTSGNGVTAVLYGSGRNRQLGFLTTTDAGAHWLPAGAIPATIGNDATTGGDTFSGRLPSVSIVDMRTWWLSDQPDGPSGSSRPTRIRITTDAGKHWSEVPATGLPADATDIAIYAVTAKVAVAAVRTKRGFSQLYTTSSSGRNWSQVDLG